MSVHRDSPRFADWAIVEECGSTGLVDDRRPFFGGDDVDARMVLIRKQINYIRRNWHQYDQFMSDLAHRMRSMVETLGPDADLARRVLSERRDWVSPGEAVTDFSAIELYTSDAGYRALFSIVNDSFRRVRFIEDVERVRSAVFLIELLTIDLFNYRASNPACSGFEGIVYRGMSLAEEDVRVFRNVMHQPVSERFVSIPLGMLSASTRAEVAMQLTDTYAESTGNRTAVLWRIHVLDLDAELLGLFRQRYPSSVVTSICAVPITDVSRFPEEKEVLLRGPFFQILDVTWRPADSRASGRIVIDAVMLNSNRDHVSTIASDGGDDRRMRALFRILVAHRRARFAMRFTADRGRTDDSRAYQRQLESSLAELETFRVS